jgi:hypothetical protein
VIAVVAAHGLKGNMLVGDSTPTVNGCAPRSPARPAAARAQAQDQPLCDHADQHARKLVVVRRSRCIGQRGNRIMGAHARENHTIDRGIERRCDRLGAHDVAGENRIDTL